MCAYINGPAGRSREGTARSLQTFAAGSPAVGSATAVLAATASAVASTVTTGITQPDAARCLIATPGGTSGNVLAVSVIIAGTDIQGNAITETLPAFTAGAATAVTSLKAFKTVTSIVLPIVGASTTVAVGTTAKLGMPVPLSRNRIFNAYLGGTKEGTAPTLVTNADVALTNITLNSTLNGTAVECDYFE